MQAAGRGGDALEYVWLLYFATYHTTPLTRIAGVWGERMSSAPGELSDSATRKDFCGEGRP